MIEADPLKHPLVGMSLVEASAGTGKTTLLVRLYLRALLVEGYGIDRILAVTYTRAATSELSLRIRHGLDAAAAELAKPDDRDAFWAALFAEVADEGLLRKRLHAARVGFDDKAVFTIHGFCQRTLAEHAFEAGAAFASEQEASDTDLRHEIVADFWRRRTGEAHGANYAAWFVATFKSPAQLLDGCLKPALQVTGSLPIEPLVDAATLPNRETEFLDAAAHARSAWEQDQDALGTWLRESPDLKRNIYRPGTVQALLDAWEAWLAAPPSLVLPKKFECLTRAKVEASLKGNASVLPVAFFTEDCGARLQATIDALSSARRQEALAVAVTFVRQELARRKRLLRVRGFDDLLVGVHDALHAAGGNQLGERIARQYPLVLVDEFQDTDPLQLEIFDTIHRASKTHALILIGDPKQAIYRFRGADVFTYLKARVRCERDETLFGLTRNYRSAKPLLDACNALFTMSRCPFGYNEIPYLPVESGRSPPPASLTVTGDSNAPTTVVWGGAEGETEIPKAEAEHRAAAVCAREIAHLLGLGRAGTATVAGEPVAAGQVAVLADTNRQGYAIQAALRRYGIAAAMVAAQSVFETDDAAEFELLLRAVAEPADGRILRRALVTRLLGVTAAELVAWQDDEVAWGDIVARFRSYYALWVDRGVAVMLAELLREEGVVARTLVRLDGERAMTNLRHLIELTGAEAAQRPGIEPLLTWLHSARTDNVSGDARQLRLESDGDLVHIATVHRAKGLQYRVVFLPFLWAKRDPKPSANAPVLAHDEDYRAVLDLGSGRREEREREAAREALAEDARKAYVALTRAESACFLIAMPAKKVEASALGRLLGVTGAEAFHGALVRWAAAAPTAVAVRAPSADVTALDAVVARPVGESRRLLHPERLQQRFHVASYSRLVAGASGAAAEAPDWDEGIVAPPVVAPPAGIHAFPAGAASGTFLHALIEVLDFAADAATIRATAAAKLAAFGLDPEWAPVLESWLPQCFATPLEPVGCSLSAIGPKQRVNELEFHFLLNRIDAAELDRVAATFAPLGPRPQLRFDPLAGQMKGYLDLVFEHDGRYWVADYKSNRLGVDLSAYSQMAIDRAMLEHRYDLQYLLYTVALHRYLGTRLADYDYERHFGGVLYLFLRGMDPAAPAPRGVWFTRPAWQDVQSIDTLLAGDSA